MRTWYSPSTIFRRYNIFHRTCIGFCCHTTGNVKSVLEDQSHVDNLWDILQNGMNSGIIGIRRQPSLLCLQLGHFYCLIYGPFSTWNDHNFLFSIHISLGVICVRKPDHFCLQRRHFHCLFYALADTGPWIRIRTVCCCVMKILVWLVYWPHQ